MACNSNRTLDQIIDKSDIEGIKQIMELESQSFAKNILERAADKGKSNFLDYLLSEAGPVSAEKKAIFLNHAILNHNLDNVNYWLEHGADIHAEYHGKNALEQAKDEGIPLITQAIEAVWCKAIIGDRSHKADTFIEIRELNMEMNEVAYNKNSDYRNDIMNAKRIIDRETCRGDKDIVYNFLIKTSDLRKPQLVDFLLSQKNTTAHEKAQLLQYAIYLSNPVNSFNYWIKAGADVNAPLDSFHPSLLHHVTSFSSCSDEQAIIVETLLKNGAYTDIKTPGKTALEQAKYYKCTKIIKIIEDYSIQEKINAEKPLVVSGNEFENAISNQCAPSLKIVGLNQNSTAEQQLSFMHYIQKNALKADVPLEKAVLFSNGCQVSAFINGANVEQALTYEYEINGDAVKCVFTEMLGVNETLHEASC